jgi:hypothetical protein
VRQQRNRQPHQRHGERLVGLRIALRRRRVACRLASEVHSRDAATVVQLRPPALPVVADVDGFAWPQAAYDGVAAIFVQFADPDMRKRLFGRIVRSLKPGGVLVLQGYTPKQLDYRTGGPPILSHLYTWELLESAFSGLSVVELREYEAEVREGQGHSGRSALIGLVARR